MLSNRWTSWWEQCTRCSGTQAWWSLSWPSQSSAQSSSPSSSLLSWSSPSSSLSPGTRAHQGEDFVAAASWPPQDPGARETGQALISLIIWYSQHIKYPKKLLLHQRCERVMVGRWTASWRLPLRAWSSNGLTRSDRPVLSYIGLTTAQCAFWVLRWPCGQKLKSKNPLSDGKKIFLRLFFLCCFRKKTLKLVSLFIFRH